MLPELPAWDVQRKVHGEIERLVAILTAFLKTRPVPSDTCSCAWSYLVTGSQETKLEMCMRTPGPGMPCRLAVEAIPVLGRWIMQSLETGLVVPIHLLAVILQSGLTN